MLVGLPMDHIHHSVLGTVVAFVVVVVVRRCSYLCLCFSLFGFPLARLLLFSSSFFAIPCPPLIGTEPLGLLGSRHV